MSLLQEERLLCHLLDERTGRACTPKGRTKAWPRQSPNDSLALQTPLLAGDIPPLAVTPSTRMRQFVHHGLDSALSRHRRLAPTNLLLGLLTRLTCPDHEPTHGHPSLLIQLLAFLLGIFATVYLGASTLSHHTLPNTGIIDDIPAGCILPSTHPGRGPCPPASRPSIRGAGPRGGRMRHSPFLGCATLQGVPPWPPRH